MSWMVVSEGVESRTFQAGCPWAPNAPCQGAQRAPNERGQGALGPPIEKVSGNTVYGFRDCEFALGLD
jgi:hypothetical protein